MPTEPFWFVDDEEGERWAVRVTGGFAAFCPDAEPAIVFTSRDRQVRTAYPMEKEQAELGRYELLELLARAKREAAARSRSASGRPAAAA